MAKSPAEKHTEVTNNLATLTERIDNLRKNVELIRTSAEGLAELRQELAVLRQRFDDHQRRVEEWNRNRWTLAGLVLAAVLAFAGNIAAALLTR